MRGPGRLFLPISLWSPCERCDECLQSVLLWLKGRPRDLLVFGDEEVRLCVEGRGGVEVGEELGV